MSPYCEPPPVMCPEAKFPYCQCGRKTKNMIFLSIVATYIRHAAKQHFANAIRPCGRRRQPQHKRLMHDHPPGKFLFNKRNNPSTWSNHLHKLPKRLPAKPCLAPAPGPKFSHGRADPIPTDHDISARVAALESQSRTSSPKPGH